jgi:hypothetical protein
MPVLADDSNRTPPQNVIRFAVGFTPEELDTLRAAGFLTTQNPTPADAANALWNLIERAFEVGLKAKEPA